jgi:hypothetical protein
MTREELINDIKNHPENHKHSFEELQNCCDINGIIDSYIMKLHSDHVDLGTNGGIRCDVVSGPCACGAWH